MKIFKATTNNLTDALYEIWDIENVMDNEPDLIVLPNGRVFKWVAVYAHYLCAKGRMTEEEYSDICECPTLKISQCLN